MINKTITKLKKIYNDSTTEEVYINQISSLAKECWRYNMNQERIFKEIVKYLNKLKLSEERHPFLVLFRDNANKLLHTNSLDKDTINLLLNSLYDYRDGRLTLL